MSWWQQRMVGFDLETTAPEPEQARIVTAAIAWCGGGLPTETWMALADPGVEIPEGASAVHGITTGMARADGRPARAVVADIIGRLMVERGRGTPLVVFNARYDLTVLDRECRRHGLPVFSHVGLSVVDPFVIDKQLDRFRKGKRTLEAICATYGATLDGAHDASFDAIAACRAAWVLGAKGRVRRQIRHWGGHEAHDRRELVELTEEWEAVRYDPVLLHAAQARWAEAERERFGEYRRGELDRLAANRGAGDLEVEDALADVLRIEAERGWPVLETMEWEEVG